MNSLFPIPLAHIDLKVDIGTAKGETPVNRNRRRQQYRSSRFPESGVMNPPGFR